MEKTVWTGPGLFLLLAAPAWAAVGPVPTALWFLGVFFAVVTLLLLYASFAALVPALRMWRNPTTPLRELRTGTAEVKGRAEGGIEVPAPLSGRSCVFYRVTVERSQGRKHSKGHDWVEVGREETKDAFRISDASGSAWVDPQGAEMRLQVERDWDVDLLHPPKPELLEFARTRDLPLQLEPLLKVPFLHIGPSYRVRESVVGTGQSLYVLGECRVGKEGMTLGPPEGKEGKLLVSDEAEWRMSAGALWQALKYLLMAAVWSAAGSYLVWSELHPGK